MNIIFINNNILLTFFYINLVRVGITLLYVTDIKFLYAIYCTVQIV